MKFSYQILFLLFFIFTSNTYPSTKDNSNVNVKQSTTITKDTENVTVKQQSPKKSSFSYFNLTPETISHFFAQPKYSSSSIKCFLKHTFNNNAYAQKFLAVNFSHVITFLSYANKSQQPRGYIESVLSLFKQKIKTSPYVNSYAFLEFLEKLPNLFEIYFNKEKEKQEKTHQLKEFINDYLYDNFNNLKKDPETVLKDMSEKIYDLTSEKANKDIDISINKLQQTISGFLEITVNKLVWSPKDQKEIWESVKLISNKLEELYLLNVIPDIEVLDELYWTLINRFCYFLEIAGNEITLDAYELINNELMTQKSLLWTLKEREPYITPKIKYLKHHLMQSHAKARACNAGIIADIINN